MAALRDLSDTMTLAEAIAYLRARVGRRCDGTALGWNLDDVAAVNVLAAAIPPDFTHNGREHDDQPGD